MNTLESILYPAFDELRSSFEHGAEAKLSPDTHLFGPGAVLDSVGLVSLIVAIEERIESKTGKAVRLVNEKAMSRERSPFRTFGSLAEYIDELLKE